MALFGTGGVNGRECARLCHSGTGEVLCVLDVHCAEDTTHPADRQHAIFTFTDLVKLVVVPEERMKAQESCPKPPAIHCLMAFHLPAYLRRACGQAPSWHASHISTSCLVSPRLEEYFNSASKSPRHLSQCQHSAQKAAQISAPPPPLFHLDLAFVLWSICVLQSHG